jgi:Fe-S-cluster containining protein
MIKQFVPSEFCLNKCRCCCRFSQQESIWSPCLLDEEINELSKHNIPASVISQNKKIRLVPFPEKNREELPAHVGPLFVCPFLNMQDNKCQIYKSRPFECQLYPFLINKRDKKIFLSADLGCPYIDENVQTKGFKEYTDYLFGLLNDPGYLDTLKKNPQIIQSYEDALDLLELKL